MPKLKQEALEEAKKNGRFDIAADLGLWRLGVDTLEIKLLNATIGKFII